MASHDLSKPLALTNSQLGLSMKFPFPPTNQSKTLTIGIHSIEITCPPEVFFPSSHGLLYAGKLSASPGDIALDMGTGTGILAILLAKQGASVTAVDNCPIAIETAKMNAQLNGVAINFVQGDLLEDWQAAQYDVIASNLPQEIIPPSLKQIFGPTRTNAIDGGLEGNETLCNFLRAVARGNYLSPGGCLYVKVNTLSHYQKTLELISQFYTAEILAIKEMPAKLFVKEHIDFYNGLISSGDILLYEKGGVWHELNMIFKLQTKNNVFL